MNDVLEDRKIGVIGAGNMGSSLVCGLLDGGRIGAEFITAVDPREEVLEPLRALGVTVGCEPSLAVSGQDLIVLGIKPQNADEVLSSIVPRYPARATGGIYHGWGEHECNRARLGQSAARGAGHAADTGFPAHGRVGPCCRSSCHR